MHNLWRLPIFVLYYKAQYTVNRRDSPVYRLNNRTCPTLIP
jgi:hypothetical protein